MVGKGTGARAQGNSTGNWGEYKKRFLLPEGRICDTGNKNVSHSEGQGYGLLCAQHCNDRETFDLILKWTDQWLRRPNDALHSWRYVPDATDHVSQKLCATDGELLMALALARAAVRWNDAHLHDRSAAIYADVLKQLVTQVGGRKILRPADIGFETSSTHTINLSYYIFPALVAGSQVCPSPIWDALIRDGAELMQLARFGMWKLPPDWLQINNGFQDMIPAPGWPPRFSFDAIRIPLHSWWGNIWDEETASIYRRFWNAWPEHNIPAWIDLETGERDNGATPGGYMAVATCTGLEGVGTLPDITSYDDYYSASLKMLAHVAWDERHDSDLRQNVR